MPNSPGWQSLLERALRGIDALEANGTPLRFYSFSGGTALMVQFEHRRSKDIDLFIHDPQYIPLLSPVWAVRDSGTARIMMKPPTI